MKKSFRVFLEKTGRQRVSLSAKKSRKTGPSDYSSTFKFRHPVTHLMPCRFAVKVFDIEQGQHEVVLNEEDARRLDIDLQDRVLIKFKKKAVTAMADHSHQLVKLGEIGVFWETALALGLKTGDCVDVEQIQRPASLDSIRKKLDGGVLESAEIRNIISDLMQQRLSNAELSAFISAVYTKGLNVEETIALTQAIYQSGEVLSFKKGPVCSEHSIGGVAGDRTSMLFVPILASMDILIPKTCSRAISSAAGTADVMELFCPVALDATRMKKVVEKTNGAIVWGGSVNMASADDKLIRIRHPLRLDPKALLLSSILAKKKAEGAKYVLLDIPTGPSAKMSTLDEARALAKEFTLLGAHLDLHVECTITDGSEPLMHAIGPGLEAKAVFETLSGKGEGPLAEKAVHMAAVAISVLRKVSYEEGIRMARHRLEDGHALSKFLDIVEAQGGNPKVSANKIPIGKFRQVVKSKEEGHVEHIDNRKISRVVRSLGAPENPNAGMMFFAMKGEAVRVGQPLFELYAPSAEKLKLGVQMAQENNPIQVGRIIMDIVRNNDDTVEFLRKNGKKKR